MKIAAFLIICLSFVDVTSQVPGAVAPDHSVADLEWMTGCWVQKGKKEGSFVSENWTKPLGMMIGTNRTIRNGLVADFEYLRIESRTDGLYYVAKPSRASGETSFKLRTLESASVVFENKEHDFPKRVIYKKDESGALTARVEDDSKGIDFHFEKTDCD